MSKFEEYLDELEEEIERAESEVQSAEREIDSLESYVSDASSYCYDARRAVKDLKDHIEKLRGQRPMADEDRGQVIDFLKIFVNVDAQGRVRRNPQNQYQPKEDWGKEKLDLESEAAKLYEKLTNAA